MGQGVFDRGDGAAVGETEAGRTKEKRNLETGKGPGRVAGAAAVAVGILLSLTACTAQLPWGTAAQPTPAPGRVDTGFVVAGPGSYDSADTAILVGKNEKESTLTFLNLDLGRRYTLTIDGAVRLSDKYGEALSLGQVSLGDIVDIRFLKSKKRLASLQLSARAWSYTDIERYEINTVRGEISIGSEVYKLTSNTQYLSGDEEIGLRDINTKDVLSFQGIDSQVLTVRVERGHGYLRLANDENFVGGWIEIGQKQIERIKEDMLLVVPEGSYRVAVSNRGAGGTRDVVSERKEETVLDIGDFEIPAPQTGRVLFSLRPSTAELYIDGEETDPADIVTLEYGLHQVIARAEGYHSITRYIRVDRETAAVDVILEEVQEEEEPLPVSSASPSPAPDAPKNGYRVFIEAPEGVEVYLDGNYVGISPCSFKKAAGVHVIILRKSGYTTRSYSIQVDDEEKDSTFSFAELGAVESGD